MRIDVRRAILAAFVMAAPVLAAGRAAAAEAVRCVEDFEGDWPADRWAFSNGPEFPGAAGGFDRTEAAAHAGRWGGCLTFDFTGGGNYVAAVLRLRDAPETAAVRLWVKKPRKNRMTFRYTDATGQTLQRSFSAPDERWADVTIPMAGWTGHWGGADDGVLHGPPGLIAILVENDGRSRGQVLFDDVRLVEGKPGEGGGMVSSEYAAARFGDDEGWHAWAVGDGGETKLQGRLLRFDFTKGASAVALVPPEFSLLGTPTEIRLRVRGKAPGHPVRVHLATHFMTFEKTVGESAGDPESEIVVAAPPGEGWRWFGGENDGKLHGPLRLRGIFLDAAGRRDAGQLELLEVRVRTASAPDRTMVMTADLCERDGAKAFLATVRSVAPRPTAATVRWTVRDWAGETLGEGSAAVTVPPGAEPVEVRAPVPAGERPFAEAEFTLQAPGLAVPPVQACYTAPLEPRDAAQRDPASPFGMGLYLYRYDGSERGLAEMDRAARVAQDAGVKWSREEFGWARVEPRKGEFDWSFYDRVVETARRHGISIYGLLSYWSAWTKPYTDEGIEDYCRYAAAAADRYRDDIRHWEVWNEPNIFFWQGPRDLYADLLKRAYTAIKKANPEALVLGCSTAGIDEKFILRTMELGGPFDILTIHPYRAALDDRRFLRDLRHVAEIARRPDGAVRPAWITEMGWATYTPHNGAGQDFVVTTQREQAGLLARAYIDAIASGVAPNISWYDFRNDGTDPFNFEHNMGVVMRDFRPKPACRAYATLTRLLEGKRPGGELNLGEGVVAFRFVGPDGGAVVALWSTEDPCEVRVPWEGAAALTDLMGGARSLESAGGAVTVRLRPETPVFLGRPR